MSVNDRQVQAALLALKKNQVSPESMRKALDLFDGAGEPADGSGWEDKCKTFGQLSDKPPRWLIHNLFPEKALTLIPAPSYNGKTWFSLQSGLALSTGQGLWGFKGPGEVVPCVYHVPEMNEAFVRDYMYKVGFEDSKDFYVRPMECDMWLLDDPYMLESSKGRYVFLDTMGYFNPADDSASYSQSIGFAKLVYRLILNGALGVAALMHPPKYASQPQGNGKNKAYAAWTLENSILGSAGYGGILRSCIRLASLNQDKNDPAVWVYAEGLKNPGLKPFQLRGIPLEMSVPPGQSPYFTELMSGGDPRKAQAFAMFEQGAKRDEICKKLKVRTNRLAEWRKEWEASKHGDADEQEEESEGPGQREMYEDAVDDQMNDEGGEQ